MTEEAVLRARTRPAGGRDDDPDQPTRIVVREVRPGSRYRYRLEVAEQPLVRVGAPDPPVEWSATWPYSVAVAICQAFNRQGLTAARLYASGKYRLTK